MAYKIFICYRRTDMAVARGIQSKLNREFGNGSVFLDLDEIKGGQKWKNRVKKAFSGDPIIVTLITTKWNSHRGGQPKLMDLDDHVRFELETALDLGLTIVPVLYERAHFPKENQIPASLHPLLVFQTNPFSMVRYDYDLDQIVGAIQNLLDEKAIKASTNSPTETPKKVIKKTPKKAQIEEPFEKTKQASLNPTFEFTNKPPSYNFNLPQTPVFTRSMFTLTPEKKKEMEARQKQEADRLKRVRAESPPYYACPTFWIVAVLTFAFTAGSIYGAEELSHIIAKNVNSLAGRLPPAPLFAAISLILLWSFVWIILGAITYSDDPGHGTKVFYTKGILGGWILAYDDWEPIGYWAAFPISTAVLWLAARGLTMVIFNYFGWNYSLVFCLILGVYTLPVLALYILDSDS